MIFDQLKVPQRKVKEEVVVMVVDWLRLLAVEVKTEISFRWNKGCSV